MAKKPVAPGSSHTPKVKTDKPSAAKKSQTKGRLISKGVAAAQAAFLSGEGEDLTAGDIAERRIDWQKELPKG